MLPEVGVQRKCADLTGPGTAPPLPRVLARLCSSPVTPPSTEKDRPAAATYLRGDFEPRFSLALARKDLGLAQELARATDTPMPLSALCENEMIEAMARGWADRDASIFLTLQEERANVQVRLPPA